jgi:hypothetical protein
MGKHRRKILLAVDGSEQSFEAVCYASQVLPPEETKVVRPEMGKNLEEGVFRAGGEPSAVAHTLNFSLLRA